MLCTSLFCHFFQSFSHNHCKNSHPLSSLIYSWYLYFQSIIFLVYLDTISAFLLSWILSGQCTNDSTCYLKYFEIEKIHLLKTNFRMMAIQRQGHKLDTSERYQSKYAMDLSSKWISCTTHSAYKDFSNLSDDFAYLVLSAKISSTRHKAQTMSLSLKFNYLVEKAIHFAIRTRILFVGQLAHLSPIFHHFCSYLVSCQDSITFYLQWTWTIASIINSISFYQIDCGIPFVFCFPKYFHLHPNFLRKHLEPLFSWAHRTHFEHMVRHSLVPPVSLEMSDWSHTPWMIPSRTRYTGILWNIERGPSLPLNFRT